MPSGRAAPERFLTTVVMTDIVGSTEHASELGDRAWHELLDLHHARIREALRRARGREVDTAGDGFFVVFDAPAAAVTFALEAAGAVAELGIDIRAGVHVGEVEQMAKKVTGITVVVASRIMAAAGPGEVLVSSTVRDLTAGSGLTFEDRGVRELKGVLGEWHVYEVARTSVEDIDSGGSATALERRASAVRRARDRPLWERRPRLVAGAVLGLAAVLVAGGLFVTKPWQPAALASVAENSIGIIDPARGEVIKAIPVGSRPGGIAVGGGYVWVTSTGEDTVSQIDPRTGSVFRIAVGRAPKGVAVTDGSVWVANSGERSVSRISVSTGLVVGDPIVVGNGPTAIAAAADGLWVANSTDSTVVRIDVRTGLIGQATAVAATPIAIAVDAGGVWVASEDGASISHLDPTTGVTRAAPIQLAARPSALALDAESAWVAAADGTVTRIDRATNRVTTTVVGRRLAAIVIGTDAIWVGDLDGTVYRLDSAAPSTPPKPLSTGSAIVALAVVGGDIWLAAQVSAGMHRGGTLRIVQPHRDELPRYDTDPLDDPIYNVAPLEADGLVGYRHVGGAAGSTLLPDLATSIPRPSNGGLTYAFQLRDGLTYATGAPVRASDFRRGLERSFQVEGFFGVWGQTLRWSILGADACAPVEIKPDEFKPIERCDLSSGIVTDDSGGTVTFNLRTPDPDFVFKLAHPSAFPAPDGVPMNELVDGTAFPGTGPYVVTGSSDNEVRLGRNPHFKSWDDAVRPNGYPDEIVFTVVADDATRIAMIENGDADYTSYVPPFRTSPELFARIKTQYAGRWHVGSAGTHFVTMSTTAAPFDDERVRKAVNFAI
ncbi:MAG TPA: ABC transporter substrate-binding protein, partial [Candidatus Limnocylindrales bacterium]